MDPDIRWLVKRLKKSGLDVERRGSGHLRVIRKDGTPVTYTYNNGERQIFLPFTPSDHRSFRNVVAELKRAGIYVK